MTKSKQILAYKEANPTHKPSDVAKACGVATAYVYQVLHKAKHKVAKKPVAPTEGQKIVREELDRLHAEIANLEILEEVNEKLLIDYEAEIEQLESDIIGYRAVISYLQGRLDGATV
jgi:3-oxoacyl-[acyl-carrier-protein] synthase III